MDVIKSCMILAVFLVLVVNVVQSSQDNETSTCPEGWKKYSKEGVCMKYFAHSKRSYDAHNYCMSHGGELVRLDNADKNAFFIKNILPKGKTAYIGLRKFNIMNEGFFKWLGDRTETKFKYWHAGMPRGSRYSEFNCVTAMGNFDGKWSDEICNKKHYYACEKEITKPEISTLCPEGWKKYDKGDVCMQYFDVTRTYSDARKDCSYYGADLVRLDDADKNSFLIRNLPRERVAYIGLRRNDIDGTSFKWLGDKTEPKFNYWLPGSYRRRDCITAYGNYDGRWSDRPCDEKHSYFCEKATTKPAVISTCPEGWKKYDKGDVCMKSFDETTRKYEDARNDCKRQGADLVRLDNADKNTFFLKNILNKERNVYIGLRDDERSGKIFRWLDDKTETKFKNWLDGIPKQTRGYDCGIALGYSEGRWIEFPCDIKFSYACEKETIKPVISTCPKGWRRYGNGEVCMKYFGDTVRTYEDARNDCKRQGADLVRLDNADKNSFFIKNVLPILRSAYIGLTRDKKGGTVFRWLDDKTETKFKYWNVGEPNNNGLGEECVIARTPNYGRWIDVPCDQKLYYVCEKKTTPPG